MKKLLYVSTGLCLLAGVFTSCEKPEKESVTEDPNIEMVYVEGGTFEMGATSEQGDGSYGNEKPTHEVTLDGFYIGKYEVTQAQWKAVMGTTIGQQSDKWEWPNEGVGDNYPMYCISWKEAVEFCKKLSQITKKTYRLPTEAEWEYAARGGNKSQHYKYAGSNNIDEVAWYEENSGNMIHPVGTKKANELGVYDMSGNVWEWCSDWVGDYSGSPAINPQGPSNGSRRVWRGGCWHHESKYCRVSSRNGEEPGLGGGLTGFRVVVLP